jgi:HSPB1-associated protein 1
VWEPDCVQLAGPLRSLAAWILGEEPVQSAPQQAEDAAPALQGLLAQISPETHWGYVSYKYVGELFRDRPELLAAIEWGRAGIERPDAAAESTFWFGSTGASTACHMDSYGVNLVAQLHGAKRWVLFPPEDSPCLYPTRVPYEESSVFSAVNVASPDLGQHPLFARAQPREVILRPGDILFVPRHWWHFVSVLEPAVNVNLWLPHPADARERVKEALVRNLVFMAMPTPDEGPEDWLCPSEEHSVVRARACCVCVCECSSGRSLHSCRRAQRRTWRCCRRRLRYTRTPRAHQRRPQSRARSSSTPSATRGCWSSWQAFSRRG